MATGRIFQNFGAEHDPASNAFGSVSTTTSSGSAPMNGAQVRYRTRTMNQSTDQSIQLDFLLPSNYYSGGTLTFKFLTGTTGGAAVFKTAWALVHPSSEGFPTDLDAAVFGTVTSSTPQSVPGTAGYVKTVVLDLGVTGAHGGDSLLVMLGRDADNAGDTLAGDGLFREPWMLSFLIV